MKKYKSSAKELKQLDQLRIRQTRVRNIRCKISHSAWRRRTAAATSKPERGKKPSL